MFNKYRNRLNILGSSFKEVTDKGTTDIMEYSFKNSTAYREVVINGKHYDARIVSDSDTSGRGGSGNYQIQFRSGISFPAGTYIDIPQKDGVINKWMIIYTSDDLLFDKPYIKKCNYLLKWKNQYGEIIERWCVFGDNVRMANGNRTAAKDRLVLPYNAFSLLLPYDNETINLRRDKRLLVDSPFTVDPPDAYIITNRNVFSKTFGEFDGNIDLSISQQQFNPETDNRELMIADYYIDYKEKPDSPTSNEYVCNITYHNSPDLKMSTPYKVYDSEFFLNGEKIEVEPIWDINILNEVKDFIDYKIENKKLYLKAKFSANLIGSHINISLSDADNLYQDNLTVKVVSAI